MSSFKNRITLQVYKTSQLSEFFHHHQSEQSKTVGGKKKSSKTTTTKNRNSEVKIEVFKYTRKIK